MPGNNRIAKLWLVWQEAAALRLVRTSDVKTFQQFHFLHQSLCMIYLSDLSCVSHSLHEVGTGPSVQQPPFEVHVENYIPVSYHVSYRVSHISGIYQAPCHL